MSRVHATHADKALRIIILVSVTILPELDKDLGVRNEKMMHIEGVDFNYSIDPELVRPSDNPIIIGSNKKMKEVM